MMGVILTVRRGFHVLNPSGGTMDAPEGMIHFSNTPVGKDFTNSAVKEKFSLAMVLSVLLFGALFWFINIVLVVALILVLNVVFVWSVKKSIIVPLAVNLNHPFMESGSLSNSKVMVKFSESWIEPGINRLKLAKDSLGCWIIHKQDDDLSVLSLWDTNHNELTLNKKLSIINQAISLNNAVNDSNDEFEDARERESQESILLERKWLPEEELDVQGPIARAFSKDK